MRSNILFIGIFCAALNFLPDSYLQAQCNNSKERGKLGTDGPVDTLYFGNNVNATYGIDSLSPFFGEWEAPPPAFCCFDDRWGNLPGHNLLDTNGMGNGLFPADIRGMPVAPLHKDTFYLQLLDCKASYRGLMLRWPDSAYLSARCDSMFLVDRYGKLPTIDMFSIDSLKFYPPHYEYKRFFIFKYGVKLIDADPPPSSSVFWMRIFFAYDVELIENDVSNPPETYLLSQNYPNPFNPATRIKFKLPKTGIVTIKIYDILGREVATLLNGRKERGEHMVSWNAENYPGGVYLYRLISGDYTQTRKMAVLR